MNPGIERNVAIGTGPASVYPDLVLQSTDRSRKLQAIVEKGDGSQVIVFTLAGSAADVDGVWHTASIPMDAFAGETVRLRFAAVDGGASNVLEVELDDVRVTRPG